MSNKKIIITGANGYIGSFLVNYLKEKGHQVTLFLRKPDTAKGEVFYDIAQEANESVIESHDVLIHCAFIPKGKSKHALEENVNGTRALIDICKKHKIKMIFFSTVSAHAAAESEYGKHKFSLEKDLDLSKDVVLKPGLVIGKGGLFSRMLDFSRKFKTIPLIEGGVQPLQFIALSDVAESVEHIISRDITGSFILASDEPMTYIKFYKSIAEIFNTKFMYIKIPVNLILIPLSLFEKIKIKIPVSKENLLGLKNMKFIDPGDDMTTLGVHPKTLKETIRGLNLE